MRSRAILAPCDATEIFSRAVQERALAVVTLQDNQGWSTFKSRFLERDNRCRFFVLDYQAEQEEQIPAVAPGQCVGVSFRQRSRKIFFATVVEAKGHFQLDERTSVAAIRYRWPESMSELQRRAFYRTPIPEQMSLLASIWQGGLTARPQAAAAKTPIITGNLADISCGGAMVHMHQQVPSDWAPEELVGVELQLPDGRAPVLLDARLRGGRQDTTGMQGVAIQFIGLELTVDGRHVLQRLANAVQRLHRLTQAAGRRDANNKYRF